MGDMKWGRDWHFRIINMTLVQQIVPGLYMYTHVYVYVCTCTCTLCPCQQRKVMEAREGKWRHKRQTDISKKNTEIP